jgi:hypothetical protein
VSVTKFFTVISKFNHKCYPDKLWKNLVPPKILFFSCSRPDSFFDMVDIEEGENM